MSTRSSIVYNDDFHLYSEFFEFEATYLSMTGDSVDFDACPGQITVRIPNTIMKIILENSDKIKEFLEDEVASSENWKA